MRRRPVPRQETAQVAMQQDVSGPGAGSPAVSLVSAPELPALHMSSAASDQSHPAPSGWALGLGVLVIALFGAGAWAGIRLLREKSGKR